MHILLGVVNMAIDVMVMLIIVRVILSYFRHDPYHPILRVVYEVTQPLLGLMERILPMQLRMPLDFSPFAAILLLQMLVRPLLLRLLLLLM